MSAPETDFARLPRIALLGGGSMGAAILAGLTRPEVMGEGIVVTNRSVEKAARIAVPGVTSLALETQPGANREAVRGARVVIVAVKPALVAAVLAEVADALDPDAIVVSVAAGVTTATMEALVPNVVVRSMPNTPALVGRGVTGLSAGSRGGSGEIELIERLFATVGEVVVVPEDRIDALSAVSGSGPAYVFLLIEQWTRAAIGLGFSPAQAKLMVEQTVRGASELLAASDAGPAELRRQVTSPKGTTERAIAVLEEADLAGLLRRAADAAIARARELAQD